MIKYIFAALTTLMIPLAVNAQQIKITSDDGFELAADFVSAKANTTQGVLMLHQCNADKSMYRQLAKKLATDGISSLALDFRLYGDSTDQKFSFDAIEKRTNSNDAFRAEVRKIRNNLWPVDVEKAYQYLVNKVGSDNISFVGASCGGGQAIRLASKHQPESFTFLSSGMGKNTIARFDKLSDIPSLIIAAVGDKFTYKSSNKIFLNARNEHTRLLAYKGDKHGHPLFKQDPNLGNVINAWIKQNSGQ